MVVRTQEFETIGRREQHKLPSRKDLLDVAKPLFSKRNLDGVTINQIVDRARVSQKTFFNCQANMSQFLHEFLLDWLATIGLWSDDEVADLRAQKIEPQQ